MHSHLVLILTFILALLHPVSSTCYLPNGTAHDDPGTQQCSFDAANPLHNTCCHGKWENAPGSDVRFGPTRDECLPNGLCQNRGFSTKEGEEAPPWTHFYRVFCTEKNWDGCLSVCDTGLNAHNNIQLTPCDGTPSSEKWCCGDTTDCCTAAGAHKAVVIPRVLNAQSINASRESRFTSEINANTYDRKRVNVGLGVGIGLGAPALLALGCVLGVFVLAGLRKQESEGVEPDVQWDEVMFKTPQRTVTELETPGGELAAGEGRVRVNVELP